MTPGGSHTRTGKGLRARVHHLLEGGDAAGPLGTAIETGLIALIIANVLAAALESVPSIDAVYGHVFDAFEFFSVVVFSIEFVLRLWSSLEDPRFRGRGAFIGRVRYALQPLTIIDLLAILPFYISPFLSIADLRFLRIFRLLRLLKIARYSPALSTLWHVISSESRALFGTLILLLCVMLLSAQLMYLAEHNVQPEKFGTLPDAMWWAIATLTTVGYGDVYPVTAIGKIIAGMTMIMGVGLIALPVGIVATGFVNEIHRRDFVVTLSMLSRVPLFEGFDHDTVGDIMNALRSRIFAADTRIAAAGEAAQAMYFVVSGQLEEESDEESRLLGPGHHFGEKALLHGKPHRMSVTARSHTRLLELSLEDFRKLLKKHPALRARIQEVAEETPGL
jgi:voltage-gated potassium channel